LLFSKLKILLLSNAQLTICGSLAGIRKMKYNLIILILIYTGCTSPIKEVNPDICLSQIDSILNTQTFREATLLAETCSNQDKANTELNLKLAELYLLSYLVDDKKDGLEKARIQFGKTLKIDTSFVTNHSQFNLNRSELRKLSEIWFAIQKESYKSEIERILIWALIEKFDSEKEPKLMK